MSKNFPNGFEVQIFPTKILEDAYRRTISEEDKEHVTLYIYNNPDLYNIFSVESPFDEKFKKIKLSLDTEEDYINISKIFTEMYPKKKQFGLYDIIKKFYKNL